MARFGGERRGRDMSVGKAQRTFKSRWCGRKSQNQQLKPLRNGEQLESGAKRFFLQTALNKSHSKNQVEDHGGFKSPL